MSRKYHPGVMPVAAHMDHADDYPVEVVQRMEELVYKKLDTYELLFVAARCVGPKNRADWVGLYVNLTYRFIPVS